MCVYIPELLGIPACMKWLISLTEFEFFMGRVGGLKRGKRKEACPTENKLKRKFGQLLQKLQFSEWVC